MTFPLPLREARRRVAWSRLTPRTLVRPRSDETSQAFVIRLTTVAAVGYLVLGRPFAYIGIPQVNLYLAELLLLASFVWRPTRQIWTDYGRWLLRGGRCHLLSVLLLLWLLTGVLQVVHGLTNGYDLLNALKSATINYSPFFLLLGMLIGSWSSGLPHRIMLALAWSNATYGVLQVFLLSHWTTTFPGQSQVPLFDLAPSAAASIVWLAANPRRSRYTALLLPLNGLTLLGHQVRGEWVGLLVGLLVWVCIARQFRRLFIALTGVVGLLAILALGNVSLPGSGSRGGTITVGGVVGRAISPFAPNEAAALAGDEVAGESKGTAEFRTVWWHGIAQSAGENPMTGLIGHGYGFPLASLTINVPDDVRTPHSVYFFTLAYTGYVGVVLLAALWLMLASLLWRVYRSTGDWFGLVFFAICIAISFTTPWFETPIGATPTYLFLGTCLAPLLTRTDDPDRRLAARRYRL